MRGLGIAKGFDKSRTNGWFLSVAQPDGTRPKKYYPTEKERDKVFTQKLRSVRTVGAEASEALSTSDRHSILEMNRLAEPTGLTAMEVFQRGLVQLNGAISVTKLTANQAAETFLAEQRQRHAEKKISDPRMKEIRTAMARFLKVNGKKPLSLCNRTTIKTYLASLKVGPQTRMNNARVLSFFFEWCVAEVGLLQNPVPEQEGVNRIPTTFTNGEVAQLFDCAREHFPALLPMLGIQWYAGLRPGATHHLDWKDIDFERRSIGIQPHGNKLRQPDIVKDMPLTVFAFLLPFRQAEGPVTHPNHIELNRQLHHKLGYNGAGKKRWPEDVARHTFASNLYSFYEQDSKRVEGVLLHSTSAMLKKHYLLKNIPLERSAAYFATHLPSA